ncbi:hypothetical protein ACA910_007900 [Epithemia clementina (nom. ined.)]
MKKHAHINTSDNAETRLSAFAICLSSVAVSLLTTALFQHYLYKQRLEQAAKRRQEERTGRIRAEVKLRTVQKELSQLKIRHQGDNGVDKTHQDNDDKNSSINSNYSSSSSSFLHHQDRMILTCIGTVQSPYTKRMGTPRQSQLVPSSRGIIHFACQAAALDGINEYSHIWIIFGFHANTNIQTNSSGQQQTQRKTKIRPPRAGGRKVGQLATRSPHRPNCLGLSLVRLERWDPSARQLHVTGLDIVNGSPVFDIKPCVPWDVPNYYQSSNRVASALLDYDTDPTNAAFRVPGWVTESDVFPKVSFSSVATDGLRDFVARGHLAPFYTTGNNGEEMAKRALEEILAQDPRSSHKGLKVNARGTTSTTDETYSLLFGRCQISFSVRSPSVIEVVDVTNFGTELVEYADGVPLVSSKENGWNDRISGVC